MGQGGLEAAAQRRALDHGQRDGARPQGFALAGPDRLGEEVEVAAHVVDLGPARARHPEVDGQARILGGSRQGHDFVDEFVVKAGPGLRPEHHPHDTTSLLVKR
ncbi:hypothetical protein G6F59_018154 [Rhizopus arrhizus]|nr:hypothetical protein G6F59_018154 [Rhizopus arrhizus]